MRWILLVVAAALAVSAGTARPLHPAPPPYHSLTREFARFADRTATMPQERRVTLVKRRFNASLPGFYEPADGQSPGEFDRQVAAALGKFPALRPQYEQAEREFPAAYTAGIAHFRTQFPDFRPDIPIWLIHSLGRMDGGTRELRGKTVLIFGADMIARLHHDGTVGVLFDHELYHVENRRSFKDCDADAQVWCAMWEEGGAVYATSVMNPGASDHQLMLDFLEPIRGAIDAKWREALCKVSRDQDKTDHATYAGYFMGSTKPQPFPQRWGYYLGYRMMQRLGQRYTLAQIDHFDTAAAHRLFTAELAAMIAEAGGCPTPPLP